MALMMLEAVGFLEPTPLIMAERVVLIGIDDRGSRHIHPGKMGPESFTGHPVVPKTEYLQDSILQCKEQKCKTSAMIVSWPFEWQMVVSLWTYRVEDMRDNQFTLTWRARTPERASRKLQDVYDPQVWQLTIKETA